MVYHEYAATATSMAKSRVSAPMLASGHMDTTRLEDIAQIARAKASGILNSKTRSRGARVDAKEFYFLTAPIQAQRAATLKWKGASLAERPFRADPS